MYRKIIIAIFLVSLRCAYAGGGSFGIDYKVPYDDSGIFARNVQVKVLYGMGVVTVSGALWYGSEERIGKTFWAGTDALLAGMVAATTVKAIFTRKRPRQTDNPNDFFQGNGYESFVSGDVTAVTAMVTPWILEYREDTPWIWGLAALPLYDSIARVKVQGHWQSDVLGGMLLGTAVGYWAQQRKTPFLLLPFKDGVFVGLRHVF